MRSNKVILLGNSGVGKTSFLKAAHGRSIDNIKSSTSIDYSIFHIEDQNIDLDVYDTAGQEQYHSLLATYYRGTDIALIFTGCEKKFIEKDDIELGYYIKNVYEELGDTFVPIFVLNKIDLFSDSELEKRQKVLKKYILERLSQKTDKIDENSLNFVSISCKTTKGVDELIILIGEIAKMNLENKEFQKKDPQVKLEDEENGKKKDDCSC